jgi:hypothetical protein
MLKMQTRHAYHQPFRIRYKLDTALLHLARKSSIYLASSKFCKGLLLIYPKHPWHARLIQRGCKPVNEL